MAEGKSLGFMSWVRMEGAGRQHLEAAAIAGAVVFVSALLGIALRSSSLLAAASPANAILLGLMVRFPNAATPAGWVAAALAYVLADLLTGNSLVNTLLLTVASLAGVAAGYFLVMRLGTEDRRLIGPFAVLRLALVLLAASAVAALFGTLINLVVPASPPLSSAVFTGFAYWLMGELVNYLAIVPVLLSLPDGLIRRYDLPRFDLKSRPDFSQIDLWALAPGLALVAALIVELFGGGFALTLVALVWCALSYSVFATAALTLLAVVVTLGALVAGLATGWPEALVSSISVQLGVTLMGLAPLTIASTMAAHKDLGTRYDMLAAYDVLSGLLTRHAFAEGAGRLLAEAGDAQAPVAVLMLDIDNFKKINHTHGHAAGDLAIQTFARVVRTTLGDSALVGRLGGEEFAALMAGSAPAEAVAAAERVRHAFASTPIDLGNGQRVDATLSIGVGCAALAPASIEPLLQVADEALSLAKGGGRNRTVRRDIPVHSQMVTRPGARASR